MKDYREDKSKKELEELLQIVPLKIKNPEIIDNLREDINNREYSLALEKIHRILDEKDEKKKEQLLDEILYYNEQDFDIVKEMFFDVNPVTETGVGSCMFPYHEMKRIIYNIRHPETEDKNVISSGVEAFGWLWL